jgi:hypothetical protein
LDTDRATTIIIKTAITTAATTITRDCSSSDRLEETISR